MRLLVLLVSIVVLCAACSAGATVGATPLQGDAHMRSYLAGGRAWKATLDDGSTLQWTFDADGGCAASIEGEGRASLHFALTRLVPEGARAVSGRWTATTERLSLTDLATADGRTVRDATLPLGWVDGKLYIEIAGRRYVADRR